MKRFLSILLILCLSAAVAFADPLPLLEDYVGEVVQPLDEDDPSAGKFEFSYRYPHVDEEAEGGAEINAFYDELVNYTDSFTIPMNEDSESSTVITYSVTCNNDDYFSVLLIRDSVADDVTKTRWEGHTFSRKSGAPDVAFDLARLLGAHQVRHHDAGRVVLERPDPVAVRALGDPDDDVGVERLGGEDLRLHLGMVGRHVLLTDPDAVESALRGDLDRARAAQIDLVANGFFAGAHLVEHAAPSRKSFHFSFPLYDLPM